MPDASREKPGNLHERRLVLSLPTLPAEFDGTRLCFFSDLHIRKPHPLYDQLVDYLRAREFDLGCCGGDVEYSTQEKSAVPLAQTRKIFAASRPRWGWFVCRGNNDDRRFIARLDQENVRVLINRSERIGESSPAFYVVGVDDPFYKHDDLDAALKDVPADAFKLLLAHAPDIIHKAERAKVPLVLCGHTHGGQIRLPWAGALVTQTRVGNEFAYGLASKHETVIYTSAGVGFAFLPVRIGCPSEVVNITLKCGDGPHTDSGPVPI